MKTNLAHKLGIMLAGVLAMMFALGAAAQDFSPEVHKSLDRAVALYPDSGVAGTALFRAIEEESVRIKQANPAFFNDADWPLMLTSKIAAKLGIQPVVQPQGVQQPKAMQNQPPPRMGGTLLDKPAEKAAYRLKAPADPYKAKMLREAKRANPDGTPEQWEAVAEAKTQAAREAGIRNFQNERLIRSIEGLRQ